MVINSEAKRYRNKKREKGGNREIGSERKKISEFSTWTLSPWLGYQNSIVTIDSTRFSVHKLRVGTKNGCKRSWGIRVEK